MMFTLCSLDEWDARKEILDETMDVSGRNCRPRYGGVVAFAGSGTTRGNATRRTTRRERTDHLRAILRFPAARSGAAPSAAGAAIVGPWSYGGRKDQNRAAQGLLRSIGGVARSGTRRGLSRAL